MKNKIDLAQIEHLRLLLVKRVEDAHTNQTWKVQLTDRVTTEITEALEELPKLRNALYQLFRVTFELDMDGQKLASIPDIVETYRLASEMLEKFEQ